MQPAPKTTPPVGPSTVATGGGALAAFVLAILAFVQGDRSTETIGALVAGAGLIVTMVVSRTRQANKLAELIGKERISMPIVGVAERTVDAGEVVPVRTGTTIASDDAVMYGGVGSSEHVGGQVLGAGVTLTPPIPPDADDSAHALTDGDPSAVVAVAPDDEIDEAASVPDPDPEPAS